MKKQRSKELQYCCIIDTINSNDRNNVCMFSEEGTQAQFKQRLEA